MSQSKYTLTPSELPAVRTFLSTQSWLGFAPEFDLALLGLTGVLVELRLAVPSIENEIFDAWVDLLSTLLAAIAGYPKDFLTNMNEEVSANKLPDLGQIRTGIFPLWKAQSDLVNEMLQEEALNEGAYLFLLHVLIGLMTGDGDAQALALSIYSAPAASSEFPNETFSNQLVYLVLMHLADPHGVYAWNNAKLREFVTELLAIMINTDLATDLASAAIKSSLENQLTILTTDSAYPMQDPYGGSGTSFPERKTDTLFALDKARAMLNKAQDA